jgi:hypothetical protein
MPPHKTAVQDLPAGPVPQEIILSLKRIADGLKDIHDDLRAMRETSQALIDAVRAASRSQERKP